MGQTNSYERLRENSNDNKKDYQPTKNPAFGNNNNNKAENDRYNFKSDKDRLIEKGKN